MVNDLLDHLQDYKDGLPNRFTIAMGDLVRKARQEAKLSQVELAERAYFRQAAISQLEQGKRDITAAELIYLSMALGKPIIYFFPNYPDINIGSSDLSIQEMELLEQARKLSHDDLRKLIAQAKALADLNEK